MNNQKISIMPIYEYEAITPEKGCQKCKNGFEHIQFSNEELLTSCPECGNKIKKVISWCRAAMIETSETYTQAKNSISDYEKQGMWSHAAELADKQSEKSHDKNLKIRALDNYKKAGYNPSMLDKHLNDKHLNDE